MPARRDTYRYTLRSPSGKILYRGITNDPSRRAAEHKNEGRSGQMHVEGPVVSRETALKWERQSK